MALTYVLEPKLPEVVQEALSLIRTAVVDTAYANRLYLVGGMVRDTLLGHSPGNDIDIVTDMDIVPLLDLLIPISSCEPVYYGKFGTGMITIGKQKVEFVRARNEAYHPSSRKPMVNPGTLIEDAVRRDFRVNTLMMDISTGELVDFTRGGLEDLEAKVLRTPLDPNTTFSEDPLRMLRAIRFSHKLRFAVDAHVGISITENAHRLRIISAERIRDELVKSMRYSAADTLFDLHNYGLLEHTPLEPLRYAWGMDQSNGYHIYNVWDHAAMALRKLQELFPNASDELIWATALHDVGKPFVVDRRESTYHFYDHEDVGARMAFDICERLRFPGKFCKDVSNLVQFHMRAPDLGWSIPAYRKLARDCDELGINVDELFMLMECDSRASNPQYDVFRHAYSSERMKSILDTVPVVKLQSPLDGSAIMKLLHMAAGPRVGEIKMMLSDAVVAGMVSPDDKLSAIQYLRADGFGISEADIETMMLEPTNTSGDEI